MFITAFTRARHWSHFWNRRIQSTNSNPTDLKSILILFSSSFKKNVGIVSQIGSRPLPFTSTPIHYSLSSNHSTLDSHTYRNRFDGITKKEAETEEDLWEYEVGSGLSPCTIKWRIRALVMKFLFNMRPCVCANITPTIRVPSYSRPAQYKCSRHQWVHLYQSVPLTGGFGGHVWVRCMLWLQWSHEKLLFVSITFT
jgi:hypothetical protein